MRRSLMLAVLLLNASVTAQELRTISVFRHGNVEEAIGLPNLVIADLDGDAAPEAISCSGGAPLAIGVRNGEYGTKWHGASSGCVAVAAGDRNGDGGMEVVTVSSYNSVAKLHVYDPRTLAGPATSLTLPSTSANDVAVANVDFDATNEIIVVASNATYVYDGATLALQWTATGSGGTDVGIGDVDGDARLEIVVDGSTGSVLDGGNNVVKWGYVGGFGYTMAVGNVDADAKAEIVYSAAWSGNITILNGDTFATSTITAPDYLQSIGIGDANNDGANEIFIGNDQWGSVSGLRPTDGFVLWDMNNPEHGGFAVAAGDIDGDGAREFIWTAGMSSSGEDVLFIANVTTETVEYRTTDLDGPFVSATADIDLDGNDEIVVATYSSESGYEPTVIEIFDARTGASEGVLPLGTYHSWMDLRRIAIGQLDADAALEIVVLGDSLYDPTLISWDGITHAQEWSIQTDYYNNPGSFLETLLVVANIDGDAVDEIIIGTNDAKLHILNGASPVIQKTLVLAANANDVAVTDININGVPDLLVLTHSSVTAYETATWGTLGSANVSGGQHVAASASNVGVATSSAIALFTGPLLTPAWSCTVSNTTALAFGSISGTTYLFAGSGTGTLSAYPLAAGPSCPTAMTLSLASNAINGITIVDATGDDRPDLLLDTYASSELHLLGLSTETFDDVDQLTDYAFGAGPGLDTAADFNADRRISVEDAFALIDDTYGVATPSGGSHALTIGSVAAAANTRVFLPVTLTQLSPSQQHAIAFRVTVTPANAVTSVSFQRAGAFAAMPALYQRTATGTGFLGYLASFNDALPDGRIGTLHLTLAAAQSTSTIRVTLDPISTAIGTETLYNHQLLLTSGTIAIGGTPTTIALATSANPSTVGQSVTFTANVSPITTGTVGFYDGNALLGLATLNSGQAAISTSALTQGAHSITAIFEGSGSHQSSVSAMLTQNVNAPAIAAPANVVATATSTTTVSVTWNAVVNAASYEVYRSAGGGAYTLVHSTTNLFFADTARTPSTTYLYKVRALASGGAPSPDSAVDAATTIVFTPGTYVQLAHLTELRAAVNAFRAAAGLGASAFTDPSPTIATPIKAVHVNELRNALNSARAVIGLPALTYTDTPVTSGLLMKAAHFQELRSGVQ